MTIISLTKKSSIRRISFLIWFQKNGKQGNGIASTISKQPPSSRTIGKLHGCVSGAGNGRKKKCESENLQVRMAEVNLSWCPPIELGGGSRGLLQTLTAHSGVHRILIC